MKYHVEVRPYRRRFRKPLQTAHGTWQERRGFLLRVTDGEGRCGFGEVAPVPWLGSESLEEAEVFLGSFAAGNGEVSRSFGEISRLPACRFGIDTALIDLRGGMDGFPVRPLEVAALLPAGPACLEALPEKVAAGFRTFKWKIGTGPGRNEREIFCRLQALAPAGSRLRVDGNGGLSLEETRKWLALLDEAGAEFVEQPLPPGEFAALESLSREFSTPLALDESAGNARQFEAAHKRGWKGLYVIKPALFGAMREGAALLPTLRPRLVFSSAFETSIGFEAVLRWASRWQADGVAAGLGTGEFLEEDRLFLHPRGPKIIRGLVNLERVWEAAG